MVGNDEPDDTDDTLPEILLNDWHGSHRVLGQQCCQQKIFPQVFQDLHNV